MNWIRQAISLVLPITVLIIVPLNIEHSWEVMSRWNLVVGLPMIAAGLTIMGITIALFIRVGKGTLAPWSPTQKLVINGPYRYMRNPMIFGVFTVLLGEATSVSSLALFQWAGLFFIINTVYFIFYEEPGLVRRFGTDYVNYKKQVRRWLPRFTAYDSTTKKS